ncbi:MAG: hypothetical protein WB041_01600, partial [Pseudolabrys sp.]
FRRFSDRDTITNKTKTAQCAPLGSADVAIVGGISCSCVRQDGSVFDGNYYFSRYRENPC